LFLVAATQRLLGDSSQLTLRRLLIRPARFTHWASPQAKTPLLRLNFSEVHKYAVIWTTDTGCHVAQNLVSLLGGDEVSMHTVVVDKATRFRTGIDQCLYGLSPNFQRNVGKVHLRVMFVAKRVEFLAGQGGRHASLLRHYARGEQASFVDLESYRNAHYSYARGAQLSSGSIVSCSTSPKRVSSWLAHAPHSGCC
jgi:hypothetical protein